MSELFDSSFFEKLNNLRLAAHMRPDRGQTGARKSSAKGSSVEFSDFREYLPGDDIRRIDWNAYGRLDRLYIKQFMEEKEVWYHILIDTSDSMRFGKSPKSRMALQLAAAFAWIVQKQLDRIEVLTGADGRLDRFSAVNGRSGFNHLLSQMENVSFHGMTDISAAVKQMRFQGKGVCIILSDFLDPGDLTETFQYLAFKKQETLLIQILSGEELEFEGEGNLAIHDMETHQELRVTMTRQSMDAYQQALKRHNEMLAQMADRYGFSWLQVVSDQDLDQVIFQTLNRKGIFG